MRPRNPRWLCPWYVALLPALTLSSPAWSQAVPMPDGGTETRPPRWSEQGLEFKHALKPLVRQVQPNATQDEILDALKDTADPVNGSTGGWDEQGGFGLVDGREAIDRFVSNPTVDIVDIRDPRAQGPIESIKIVFSQTVEGFNVTDLTLTRDGGPNLLTGAQTVQSTDGGRTWLLRNLRELTTPTGHYTLTLNATGSGIVNTSTLARPLLEGAIEEWDNLPFPGIPSSPTNLRAKVVDEGVVRLRWNVESGNED